MRGMRHRDTSRMAGQTRYMRVPAYHTVDYDPFVESQLSSKVTKPYKKSGQKTSGPPFGNCTCECCSRRWMVLHVDSRGVAPGDPARGTRKTVKAR